MQNMNSSDELQAMEAELGELSARHAALKQEAQRRSLFGYLDRSPSMSSSSTDLTGTNLHEHAALRDKVVSSAIQQAKRRKLEEHEGAFRLGGFSLFSLPRMRTAIRFDTCYQGQYFEQYYVILQSSSSPSHPEGALPASSSSPSLDEEAQGEARMTIFKHTLPYFVPVGDLERHVADSLPYFISVVSEYMNAYVARRQQVFDAIAELGDQNPFHVALTGVQHSQAYDDVRLTFSPEGARGPYTVALYYDDLRSSLPTRALVKTQVLGVSRRVVAKEAAFLKNNILDALETL